MEGVKELPEDVTAAAAVPTIDWVYIRRWATSFLVRTPTDLGTS